MLLCVSWLQGKTGVIHGAEGHKDKLVCRQLHLLGSEGPWTWIIGSSSLGLSAELGVVTSPALLGWCGTVPCCWGQAACAWSPGLCPSWSSPTASWQGSISTHPSSAPQVPEQSRAHPCSVLSAGEKPGFLVLVHSCLLQGWVPRVPALVCSPALAQIWRALLSCAPL